MVTLILASASPARRTTLQAAGIDPQVLVSTVDEAAVLAEALAADPALPPPAQVLALAQAKARNVAQSLFDAPDGAAYGSQNSSVKAVATALSFAPDDEPRRGQTSSVEFGGRAGVDDPCTLVLGCDSMLELDGEVVGKPSNAAEAVARIRQQSGRSAVLHTGHWLIDLGTVPAASVTPAPPPAATAAGDHPRQTGATSSTTVFFAELTDAEIAAYVATGEPLQVAGAFTIDGLGGPFIRGLAGDHHGVVGLSLPLLRDLLTRFDLTIPDLWRPNLQRV